MGLHEHKHGKQDVANKSSWEYMLDLLKYLNPQGSQGILSFYLFLQERFGNLTGIGDIKQYS